MSLRAGVTASTGALGLGRVAAVLSVASLGVHLLQVTEHSLAALAMVAMAAACLPCAWRLWRGPNATAWRLVAAMDLGMLLLHLPLGTGALHPGHDAAGAPRDWLWVGLALVVTQLALSTLFLLQAVHGHPRRQQADRAPRALPMAAASTKR